MKRYFSSEDDTPVETVKVKAIKRGNVTGKKGIFHFDPKGKDPLARSRTVPVEVALEAKAKGLVEYVGRGSARTSGVTEGTPLADAVANRRATSIENDLEDLRGVEYFGNSGSDTRDTTAFSRDPSKFARTGVQSEEDNTSLTDEETEVTDLSKTEDADDDEDDETDGEVTDQTGASTAAFTADETLSQEGNAGGADSPPNDDDDTGANGSTDTSEHPNAPAGNESEADTSAVVDATTDTAAPPVGPKPRRNRSAAAQG